ncbi:MAG: hypothetical protein QG599_3731 [Pseudomonadota bacterium]|nr:hypothetical protein [Pseudomonadota bacterium]
MTLSDFITIIQSQPDGVILLEGRRNIPVSDYEHATRLARSLAQRFPPIRFRSGNAEGADQAFSEGVAQVNASRLQVIAPYASHRKSFCYADAIYVTPDSLSRIQEDEIAYKTKEATPKNKGLVDGRTERRRLAAKAAYLIRDTMKVTGYSEDFRKPICALFYVDINDPMAGGTGHTIRVCEQEGVPVVFQNSWKDWIEEDVEQADGGNRSSASA